MQALGEKVSHVEIGSDISDAQCFALDPLANSKVASVDVLDARAGRVRPVDRLGRSEIIVEDPERVSSISFISNK